jgi:uncharacterized protein with NRDE domain
MCLVVVAVAPVRGVRLLFLANRDERLDRPTQVMHPWPDGSGIVAGVDTEAGGTWFGIQPSRRRLAAVTNVRDVADLRPRETGERSRGSLVISFLHADDTPEAFAAAATSERAMRGFNLLTGDASGLYWTSNRGGQPTRLEGLHAVSNAQLDTPWPKVVRAKALVTDLLASEREPEIEALFRILADEVRPPDEALPSTGVGLPLERALGPIHIAMPGYGTRSSTVLVARDDGTATLVERTNGVSVRFDVPWT